MSDFITIQNPTTGEAWTSGFRGQPPSWVQNHPEYIAFRKEHPAKNNKYKKVKSETPRVPVAPKGKKVRKNTLVIPYATSSPDPFIQDLINNRENFKKALVCNSLVRKSWGALSVDLNSLLATFCDRFACFAYNAKYVNVKGYDAMKGEVKISNKAMKTMFQKTKGNTNGIIMSNKMNEGEDAKQTSMIKVEDIVYDYIIVVQTEGALSVAVAKYSDVKHLIVQKKNTTNLSIPLSNLTYIVSPTENYNFEDSDYEYESPENGLVFDPMKLDAFVDLICSHFWNEVKLPVSQYNDHQTDKQLIKEIDKWFGVAC